MRKRYEMQGAERDLLEDYRNSESNKRKDSIHSVHVIVGILLFGFICSLYGIAYYLDGILPIPLQLNDEKENPDRFIAKRAQNDLEVLVNIGTRLVGSYQNEELAVDYLRREITFIHQSAHKNQTLEVDVQTVSGSYYLDFKPYGAINAYGNVQNVIVKLHSKNNSKHSLLVNAHFDSAPTSPGGSDDGINCVAMLEILRKLSRSPDRLEHNIIFLFNGAEETPLQASHGFITKHKWASEVKVVINLEAAGAGGKEILFQAGPSRPWLLKYYAQVPHPNGQVAGEELFQSGLIPSDTDFRIFRDFGNAVGLDFAFARDGYRYHTKFDEFKNIPLGSYQHLGDNALSLVRSLGNAPELNNPEAQPEGNSIYFDFFGLFFVSYSQTTATIMHCIVIIVSCILAVKGFYEFGLVSSYKSAMYISLLNAALLTSWIISGVVIFCIAFLLDLVKFTMSWYGNPWIIFGLYFIPAFSSCCGTLVLFNEFYKQDNLSMSVRTQVQLHLTRLVWTFILLIGTFCGLRFIYAIFIPLLFQTVAFAIIHIFCLQHSLRKWQIVYFLGTIIPSLFLMQQTLQILGVLIPICGRMGSDRNPDLYIGLLVCLLTILIFSYYVPLITLVRQSWILFAALGAIFVIFFVIVFTPLGFPYSGNVNSPAAERFWILHTSRIMHDRTNDISKRDSGFFVLNMDRNSPHTINKYIKNFRIQPVTDDCKNFLFCGLPIVSSRALPVLDKSTWIPAVQPLVQEPIKLQLNSRLVISDSITRFNFTASGPPNMAIYISPKDSCTLKNTSLSEVPFETMIWNRRPAYIILYTWGKTNTPLVFSLDFISPPKWKEPIFDIALTGKYFDVRTNTKTPQYTQFLNQFPNWTNIIPSLGTYESWIY